MSEEQPVILIVEDDLDVADMLSAYFSVQGYEVRAVNFGEDALKVSQSEQPDLVILDIRLPDIDGFEVARRLRHNRRTQNVPIIFLTDKRARTDRLHGLELGADDYITKPFDVQELRLRVRNALSRSILGSVTNPITNLPEGTLVDDRLKECLKSSSWAILLVGLRNLDSFREVYGFVASDDVLRAVSLMINNAVGDLGSREDFVGQISPVDFIIVTKQDALSALAERIESRLTESLDYFYPLKDRGRKDLQQERLALRLNTFTAKEGLFADLESLKNRLAVD